MKRLAIVVLALTLPLAADTDTSRLVEASKKAKPKRKASTSKVITNKDVKNSKGKLIELAEKPLPPVEKKADGPSALQQQDERHKARLDAQDRVGAAAKRVTDLEKRLADIEQSYFEANDPNHRDSVIRKKFADARRDLEKARQELLAAAGTLDSIAKP
jgi:hypothetical protein